jgi:hypothetical protein
MPTSWEQYGDDLYEKSGIKTYDTRVMNTIDGNITRDILCEQSILQSDQQGPHTALPTGSSTTQGIAILDPVERNDCFLMKYLIP